MELLVCHFSKIGYLGTLLKLLPSYAPVKQRRWERALRGFLCQRERFSKEIKKTKNTVHFLKVSLQIYSPLDTVVNVAIFLKKGHVFFSSLCILY